MKRAHLTVDRFLLVAFMLLALVLRVEGPLNEGLWFDEMWMIIDTMRGSVVSLFTSFPSDNHHPLYAISAWASAWLFGEEVWAVRLPALIFGVASIGTMWTLSLRVTGRAEAVLATLLLCLSYHHIWFSQNARGYTMLLFWTLAATYWLLETYDGAGRRAWLFYATCLALATFTHSSAVLLALGQGLVSLVVVATASKAARKAPRPSASGRPMIVARERRDGPTDPIPTLEERWAPLIGLFAAGGLSLLLHAGLLSDMLAFFSQENGGVRVSEDSQWFSIFWTIGAVVESVGVPPLLGYLALSGGLVVVGAGVIEYYRRDWRQALVFVVPVIVSVAVTVALGRSLRPRFLFHFAGFGLLILIAGTFALVDRAVELAPGEGRPRLTMATKAAAALAMVLASLAILPPAYTLPKQDFAGALDYVQEARGEGEEIVTVGLTVLPYRGYYGLDFPEIGSVAQLDSLTAAASAVYVLHTIPIYLESTDPSLAARLVDSAEVARFPGSLGGGDVVVYRLEGRGGT